MEVVALDGLVQEMWELPTLEEQFQVPPVMHPLIEVAVEQIAVELQLLVELVDLALL
jgi:hypothetical protein